MRTKGIVPLWSLALASALVLGNAAVARDEAGAGPRVDVVVASGVQILNETGAVFPEAMVNIPVCLASAFQITPLLAIEADVTWMLAVEQSISVGHGPEVDRKSPDALLYQASLLAKFPRTGSRWVPYMAVGAGAVTFLSNDDADRQPASEESVTAFAVNVGVGTVLDLSADWGVRADFREYAVFPAGDAWGDAGVPDADTVWLERATLGLVRRF